MKIKNNRGVSIMVSYVLLVVIAVGLSAILYTFLKIYVPKEKPECVDGINIAITEAQCISKTLTLNIQNRGRFKISAVYVRLGLVNREYREWINDPNNFNVDYKDFNLFDEVRQEQGLFPGDIKSIPTSPGGVFTIDDIVTSDGQYVLEVQPAIYTGRAATPDDLALCPPITQTIDCTS